MAKRKDKMTADELRKLAGGAEDVAQDIESRTDFGRMVLADLPNALEAAVAFNRLATACAAMTNALLAKGRHDADVRTAELRRDLEARKAGL